MPSRRAVLGAAGTAGLGATAAGVGTSIRVDPPAPRSPVAATWPLDRFDAANTAANRAASLPDGSRRWRRPVGTHVRDVAASGESVVVGTGTPNGGAVLALDQADGSERWRRAFDHGVTAVAPVDGAVFAATLDGSVVALR